jgi:AraC family transcriptional regulator, transcriptional activator of pobA
MSSSDYPSFFLYGEACRTADRGFLHVEELQARCRPNGWAIQLHRHLDLHHLFHITRGKGFVLTEHRAIAFVAPQIIVVPAPAVHGFRFDPETSGQVLTGSAAHFASLLGRSADLIALTRDLVCAAPARDASLAGDIRRLAEELSRHAFGHETAAEARLLAIMVDVLRSVRADGAGAARPGSDESLVAHLRRVVEARFREGLTIADYAGTLGVTVPRLRRACRSAMLSPGRIVQERRLIEAKRLLLTSTMSIAEVGDAVGLSDPAYFSRAFGRWVGEPPSSFRSRHQSPGAPPP